jgi:hypothetical protein
MPTNLDLPLSFSKWKVLVGADDRTPRGSFRSFAVSVPVLFTIVVNNKLSTPPTELGAAILIENFFLPRHIVKRWREMSILRDEAAYAL